MWGGWPNATPVPFPPVGYRATAVLSYGRRGVGALLPPAPSHSHHPAHQAGTLMNKMPLETRLAATDPPPTLPSLPVVLPLQPCARVDPPPRPSPLLPNSILPGLEGGGGDGSTGPAHRVPPTMLVLYHGRRGRPPRPPRPARRTNDNDKRRADTAALQTPSQGRWGHNYDPPQKQRIRTGVNKSWRKSSGAAGGRGFTATARPFIALRDG